MSITTHQPNHPHILDWTGNPNQHRKPILSSAEFPFVDRIAPHAKMDCSTGSHTRGDKVARICFFSWQLYRRIQKKDTSTWPKGWPRGHFGRIVAERKIFMSANNVIYNFLLISLHFISPPFFFFHYPTQLASF